MSVLDRASGTRRITSSSASDDIPLRERGKIKLVRLVLTLYTECATLKV